MPSVSPPARLAPSCGKSNNELQVFAAGTIGATATTTINCACGDGSLGPKSLLDGMRSNPARGQVTFQVGSTVELDDALDKVESGDTVSMASGSYFVNGDGSGVVVDEVITIIGSADDDGNPTTILSAAGSSIACCWSRPMRRSRIWCSETAWIPATAAGAGSKHPRTSPTASSSTTAGREPTSTRGIPPSTAVTMTTTPVASPMAGITPSTVTSP